MVPEYKTFGKKTSTSLAGIFWVASSGFIFLRSSKSNLCAFKNMVSTCQDPDRQIRIFGWYAIFVRIVRIYGQKMVKKSQNQDILHFVFHCVRMMSGYFRNFNPPSPRSNPFSYPVNIVTFVVCWGVSDYCSVINPINLSYFLLLLLLYFL